MLLAANLQAAGAKCPQVRSNFYSPAPYPEDEAYRQQVVQRLLERSLPLGPLQTAVDAAADLFRVRYAAMTLLDDARQWLPARHGLDVDFTSRAVAFCGHTIHADTPMIVKDARVDERFAGNPLVLGASEIRSYVGIRLMVSGAAVGALCVLNDAPLPEVPSERVDQLRELASGVVRALEDRLKVQVGPFGTSDASSIVRLACWGNDNA